MGRSGDTRKDTSRVFGSGVRTHKYDLHLFHVLPGAPAVVHFSCLFQALILPTPPDQSGSAPREGAARLLSTERSEQSLREPLEDPQAPCGTCQGQIFQTPGDTNPLVF